jgi:hypothetical protein
MGYCAAPREVVGLDFISTSPAGGQRGVVSMSASDRFSELRQRVEQGESNIKAAASEDSAKLEAKADEARKAADEHAAQFATTCPGDVRAG